MSGLPLVIGIAGILLLVFFGLSYALPSWDSRVLRILVNVFRVLVLVAGIICVVVSYRSRLSGIYRGRKGLSGRLLNREFGSDRLGTIELEWKFQRLQAEYLGSYLAKSHRGKRVVLLREPLLKAGDGRLSVNVMRDGLLSGIDDQLEIVGEVELEMRLPKTEDKDLPIGVVPSPWSIVDLEGLLADIGEYDILVTCVGLPPGSLDYRGRIMVPCLSGKKLVLAAGYSSEYEPALKSGTIIAALTCKEDLTFDDKSVPADKVEAFEKRYALLTPESMAEEALP